MNKEVVKENLIRFLIFIFLIAMPNLFWNRVFSLFDGNDFINEKPTSYIGCLLYTSDAADD